MARVADAWLDLIEGPPDRHGRTHAAGRAVFVKRRAAAPHGFFESEARGLHTLARAGALRTPEVLAVSPCGIVLEDLGNGRPASAQWHAAGAALARLHGTPAPCFGFEAHGFCGDSPQDNTPDDDGYRFFAERRLLPQARRAYDAGLLDRNDSGRVETVAARLARWIPAATATLVHGDLWSGNLHACADGELALIDGGAVHHGWADGDLAMLTLFGEPPATFFAGYEGGRARRSGWREYAPLLNLYHLLNHVNLFGAGYLGAVRSVLGRYA